MSFETLKERQSAMWGSGPFERIAETLADVHATTVESVAPESGEHVLDVACGTGELAQLAARRGARVSAIDFAPALIETAKRQAAEGGFDIAFEVGDCENLAFPDAHFDAVVSTFGLMFAPDHARTAFELARVVRPGGRIALATWDPAGTIGDFFRMLAPYQPPPPEGAGSPLKWGDRAHVESLLGDAFELTFEDHVSELRVPSPEEGWELLSANFGPIATLAATLDPARLQQLRADIVADLGRFHAGEGVSQPRAWLLIRGTRR